MKKARWGLVIFAAGWLLVWLVKVVELNLDKDRSDIHVSVGYLKTVDLFIRHNWIRYNERNAAISPNFDPGSPMERFYNDSFLKRDVEAFNGGDHTRFRVENGQIVNINPYTHNIALPFRDVEGWRGSLTYRPLLSTRAMLRGKNEVISLTQPKRDLSEAVNLPMITLYDYGKTKPLQRQTGDAVEIFGEGNLYFGKTHLVGDSIVFNNRDAENRVDVSISGEPVLQGHKARLDTGDLIKFDWKSGNRSYYSLLWSTVTEDAPAISHYRFVNGKWQHSPEHPKPLFMDHVVRSLNNTFWSENKAVNRNANDFDLALTLDAHMQEEIQTRLAEYCRSLRGNQKKAPLFRGAVTVMDANTGELLSLASFPEERDLENFDAIDARRNRLLRNHNLSRLPIGSVAKVILAAGILDAEPGLADLKIPEHGEGKADNILGIKINPELSDHAVYGYKGWIDFERFLEQSSNRYAAVFLTLATGFENNQFTFSDTEGEVDNLLGEDNRFMLGGKVFDRRPNLKLDLRPGADGEAVSVINSRLEHEPHAQSLYKLFEVATTRKQTSGGEGRGDDLLDTTIWLPLLKHLYADNEIPLAHAFYGISPERENLGYNLIDNYRTRFISMILGGASSSWTNVKLTEIFSRMVTGEKVEASIVRRLQSPSMEITPWEEREKGFEPLGMNEQARDRLLNAMTRVAGPNGTARQLNAQLNKYAKQLEAEGKVLGFFSKTGSPDNVSFVPTQAANAVNKLIRAGALYLGADQLIHYRNHGAVTRVHDKKSRELVFSKYLKSHRDDRNTLNAYGVSPRMVINLCEAHNNPAKDSPFRLSAGKLSQLKNVRQVESIGGVYTFTMGIYDKKALKSKSKGAWLPTIDVNEHKPERALTVSVIIETKGDGPTVAVPFAGKLIDEVLWDALNKGW